MRKGFTLIELMIVIAIIAIIAAIAIPNLLESRVTANEAAASASLKSGVFPAQVQFQAGGYQDVDADNVGEYGTLQALTGTVATNKIAVNSIKLLQGPLATTGNIAAGTSIVLPGSGVATGFRFLGYAPSSTDTTGEATVAGGMWYEGSAAPTALAATAENANNGEKYWIVACAPEKFGDTGRRAFLVSNDGQVRSPATAASLAAFFSTTATTTPNNGTASTAALMQRGIAMCLTGTNADLAVTSLDNINFHSSCPVYSK